MTEDEARSWVERAFDVPRETMARLDAFDDLLRAENAHQNLVSKTSLDSLWLRHIADSAQLVRHSASHEASWADLAEAVFAASASSGGPSARVRRIETKDYPTPARRPADSRLDTARLQQRYGIALPDWRASVGDCVSRLQAGRAGAGSPTPVSPLASS